MRVILVGLVLLLVSGCVAGNFVIGFHEYPYPYSYHEETKSCKYYLYHKFYEGGR